MAPPPPPPPKVPKEIDFFNKELANVPPSGKDKEGYMNFIWQWDPQ
jgi:hypothetical protein